MANPNSEDVIMQALSLIMVPGTRLQTLNGPVYIEDTSSLAQGIFPAVLIEPGPQRHTLLTNAGYDGSIRIMITYMDRWDGQSATVDQIQHLIRVDLMLMMANIQHNPSLAWGGVAHATAVPQIDISPYKGDLDYKIVPGFTVVKHSLAVTINMLPYDV